MTIERYCNLQFFLIFLVLVFGNCFGRNLRSRKRAHSKRLGRETFENKIKEEFDLKKNLNIFSSKDEIESLLKVLPDGFRLGSLIKESVSPNQFIFMIYKIEKGTLHTIANIYFSCGPFTQNSGEIDLLVVSPAFRGGVLAKLLLVLAIQKLISLGARTVFLTVGRGGFGANTPARKLYESVGFFRLNDLDGNRMVLNISAERVVLQNMFSFSDESAKITHLINPENEQELLSLAKTAKFFDHAQYPNDKSLILRDRFYTSYICLNDNIFVLRFLQVFYMRSGEYTLHASSFWSKKAVRLQKVGVLMERPDKILKEASLVTEKLDKNLLDEVIKDLNEDEVYNTLFVYKDFFPTFAWHLFENAKFEQKDEKTFFYDVQKARNNDRPSSWKDKVKLFFGNIYSSLFL